MRHFLCQSRYLFMGFMKKMKVDVHRGSPPGENDNCRGFDTIVI
jgi:hypothetical protein